MQPAGAAGGVDREAQLPAAHRQAGERRSLPAVEPREHLARRHDRDAAGLRGLDDRVRPRVVGLGGVGVHVRGDDRVVALRTDRVVEQHGDLGGDVLVGLVGELRGRLVDVDQRAVGVGEALREARPGEEAGAVLDPRAGPVVVVRVEADALPELGVGHVDPAAPHDAVAAARDRARGARPRRRELVELDAQVRGGALKRGVVAGLVVDVRRAARLARAPEVQPDLEARGLEIRHLLIADGRAGEQVARRAHALPVGHRAAGRAVDVLVAGELPDGALGLALPDGLRVVVAGHHDGRLEPPRQVPEPRQRHPVLLHGDDEVGQQSLLLVGRRHLHAGEVDPVGEEQVVGAQAVRVGRRVGEIALLAHPRRVALARVDHRLRQVVGEGSGLAARAADAAQRDRRAPVGGAGVGQRRDCARAVQRVEVGVAVELHRAGGHAAAGRGRDRRVRDCAARVGDPEQRGEHRRRLHRDQVAAALHPRRQRRRLVGAERSRREHDHAMAGEQAGAERPDVGDVELVEALAAQDLGHVAAEAVGAGGHDQDRPTGRRGNGCRGRRSGREEECGGDSQRRRSGQQAAAYGHRREPRAVPSPVKAIPDDGPGISVRFSTAMNAWAPSRRRWASAIVRRERAALRCAGATCARAPALAVL